MGYGSSLLLILVPVLFTVPALLLVVCAAPAFVLAGCPSDSPFSVRALPTTLRMLPTSSLTPVPVLELLYTIIPFFQLCCLYLSIPFLLLLRQTTDCQTIKQSNNPQLSFLPRTKGYTMSRHTLVFFDAPPGDGTGVEKRLGHLSVRSSLQPPPAPRILIHAPVSG